MQRSTTPLQPALSGEGVREAYRQAYLSNPARLPQVNGAVVSQKEAVAFYGRALAEALLPVQGFEALVGEGVRGTVEGREVFVGSRVRVDGRDAGGFAFRDQPKPNAAGALMQLRRDFGVACYMVNRRFASPGPRGGGRGGHCSQPRVRRASKNRWKRRIRCGK